MGFDFPFLRLRGSSTLVTLRLLFSHSEVNRGIFTVPESRGCSEKKTGLAETLYLGPVQVLSGVVVTTCKEMRAGSVSSVNKEAICATGGHHVRSQVGPLLQEGLVDRCRTNTTGTKRCEPEDLAQLLEEVVWTATALLFVLLCLFSPGD